MPFVEGDEIEGYEAFDSVIGSLEKDSSKQPLFILFTGSNGSDGKSWCPDCVKCKTLKYLLFYTKNARL
jgi:hypothetical protein